MYFIGPRTSSNIWICSLDFLEERVIVIGNAIDDVVANLVVTTAAISGILQRELGCSFLH